MSAEASFRTILRNDAPVAALCGGTSNATFRMWVGERVQGSAFPALTVELESINPQRTKDLTTAGDVIDEEFLLLFCYALDYDGVRDLANKARTALDYTFNAEQTIEGVNIQYIRIDDEDYFIDKLADNNVHTIEQRYRVRVRR